MQTEKAMNKNEAMAEIKEKILSTTIKEITPFGIKLELNLEGQLTGELYTAHHMETVSLVQNVDGSFESEARAIENTRDGDMLVISYRGSGKQTGPTTMWGESEGIIMTQSKRLSQLNNARVKTEVTADVASGEVVVKYFKS